MLQKKYITEKIVEGRGPMEVEPHDKALRRSTRERKENVYLKKFIQ